MMANYYYYLRYTNYQAVYCLSIAHNFKNFMGMFFHSASNLFLKSFMLVADTTFLGRLFQIGFARRENKFDCTPLTPFLVVILSSWYSCFLLCLILNSNPITVVVVDMIKYLSHASSCSTIWQ